MVTDKLVNSLPGYFDRHSYPIQIFSVGGSISLKFDHDARTLTVVSSIGDATVIPTGGLTVAQIKTALTDAGFTVDNLSTTDYDNLLWFVLVDGSSPDTGVYYEQSTIRRLMSAIAQFLVDTRTDYQNGINQVFPAKAQSFWLDYWGAYFGWSRIGGELDTNYFSRMRYEIFATKSNNKAVERFLNRIALQSGLFPAVSILDHESKRNTFKIMIGALVQNLSAYAKNMLKESVERCRAAGCIPEYYGQANLLHTAGWSLQSATVQYTSANSFTATDGDYTSVYVSGASLKLSTNGTIVYATVSSSSVVDGKTVVVLGTSPLVNGPLSVSLYRGASEYLNDAGWVSSPILPSGYTLVSI